MSRKISVSVSGKDDGDIWTRLASEFEVVDLDTLQVDRASYQRGLSASRVKQIADEYDIAAAGLITLNRRSNGLLWVVDGQHRAAGAKRAGESEILAQVFHGLSIQQEARLFRIKNSQLGPVSALATFRSALVEGQEEAVTVNSIIESFGSAVNEKTGPNGNINAIGAVLWVFRSPKGGGREGLEAVLSVIRDGVGSIGSDKVPGDLFKGVHWFLTRHAVDGFDRARLIRGIEKMGVDGLKQSAIAYRMATGAGGYVNWYRAVLAAYNSTIRDSSKRLGERLR